MYRFLFIIALLLSGCNESKKDSDKLQVLTTTNILQDLVSEIGANRVEVRSLMGPGVDPHLYKASEGDVLKIYNADLIFYNGLHLEGKLTDVFFKLSSKRTIINLGDHLPAQQLISSSNFGGNYDPHVWFNVSFISQFCNIITRELSTVNPENKEYFERNNKQYQQRLENLKMNLDSLVKTLPQEKRILVTAHDAFGYFGKSFNFKVVGLQGISTATEAGVKDVRDLASFIITHDVKSIFIENSVPKRMVEALVAAVQARGKNVSIGGELYSDTLGHRGTEEGTYIGVFTYNVTTIIKALK